MKIIAIIPARYQSTRLPGKPLIDICGKPMIYWVYNQVKKVKEFNDVVVATDDDRIAKCCYDNSIKYIITRNDHPNHINRISEVSEKITADYYFSINGDEPLIDPVSITKIIPDTIHPNIVFAQVAMRTLKDPVEAIDPANIKVLVNKDGKAIYLTRSLAPYPKGTINFNYNKYIGIECFNKKALDFFINTPIGILEKIEDIDHLRFIENGEGIFFVRVESDSLSVDTENDLHKVRRLMEEKNNG